MKLAHSNWVVVINGSMNPSIHHPTWYRVNGIIDSDAEQLALKKDLVCSKKASEFRTSTLHFLCLEDRWQIDTEDSSELLRLADIAGVVFDDKLRGTPILSFGLHFQCHRDTRIENVGQHFGNAFCEKYQSFWNLKNVQAASTIKTSDSGREITIRVEPSPNALGSVFLSFHYHYLISQWHKTPGHFELKPLLQEAWQRDEAETSQTCMNFIEELNGAQEGN